LQVFFCKYNDPSYVKMEKLDIMMKLVNERNIDQVGAGGAVGGGRFRWVHVRARAVIDGAGRAKAWMHSHPLPAWAGCCLSKLDSSPTMRCYKLQFH
jgi:hypothetical protein